MAIRTILFDLGNVLLNFSHDRMCRQIGDVFGVSASRVREVILSEGLYYRFDRGEISESAIHELLQETFDVRCKLEDLKRAVGDIFEPNTEMNSLLPILKDQGMRLVLLSNTCVTHINWIRSQYETLSYFDDLVLSYEVGACKPDEEIFLPTLSKIDCQPEECFYTDDIEEYVLAGRSHGLNGEVFTNAEKFRHDLQTLGVDL